MNDEHERLLRQLEQATARSTTDVPADDEEVAELREAWLAFGDLLNESDRSADMSWADDIFQPQTSPTKARKPTLKSRRETRSRNRRTMFWLTFAASMLVVASLCAWIIISQFKTSATTPEIAETPTDTNIPPEQVAVDPELPPTTPTESDAFLWNDSFDERFAYIDQQISGIRTSKYTGDASLSVLEQQFEAFGESFDDSSL